MGGKALQYSYYHGDKQPGQTRLMRNANLKPEQGLIDSFNGLQTIKETFE